MKNILLFGFYFLILNTFLFAQWPNNANDNLRVCFSDGVQSQHQFVSDSSGGFIVTWADTRDGATDYQIYAQRISADGYLLWDSVGVAICTDTLNQWEPAITSDQQGGAIITWSDYRSGGADIYAQRINGSGQVQWQANGVMVCDENRGQNVPVIVSDENSGAIIAWQDNRGAFGTYDDIYAQRVDSSGNMVWTQNGVWIHDNIGEERYPQIVPDGNGGAIVSWWTLGNHIYAQKINSSGGLMWSSTGVRVSINGTNYPVFKLVSDENGGAIIVWRGVIQDISARRIDSSGNYMWSDTSETIVCINSGNQETPHAASDGNGGVYVTWVDGRAGGNPDIYGQHVSVTGNLMWSDDGILLSDYHTYIPSPKVISNPGNGAYFSWVDQRVGNALWSQKILPDSTSDWGFDGVLTAGGVSNTSDVKMMSDGDGNFYTIFAINGKVYAKKVLSDGSLGTVSSIQKPVPIYPKEFIYLDSYPNPFNPETNIKLQLEEKADVKIIIYTITGKLIRTVYSGNFNSGDHVLQWNGANENGEKVSSGLYIINAEAISEQKNINQKKSKSIILLK